MRKMLRTVGLEQKRDYAMIEAPLPTMRAILAEPLALVLHYGVVRPRGALTSKANSVTITAALQGARAALGGIVL